LAIEEIIRWFVLDAVAAGGAGGIVYGVLQLVRRAPELQWPTTDGVVRESRLQKNKGWAALIRYSYTWEGERYQCTRISPLYDENNYRSQEEAERDRRRYPYGATVPVYVNPANPADAVIEPVSGKWRALMHLLGGIVMVLGAVTMMLVPWE
jgi:hypothetical protein